MKALFCFYGPNLLGGPTTWVRRMLPRLAARGMDVAAVSYQTADGSCAVVSDLQTAGVAVDVVDASHLPLWEGWSRLQTVIAARDPDVLVADHVLPAFIRGSACRIPVVLTLRSDDDWYHHLLDRFVSADDMRVAAIVAVSRELAAAAEARAERTGIHVMCCSSGTVIPRKTARWRSEPFHAVYVGRLEEGKRILEMLDVLIATSRALPNFSATLYGDGSLRAEVERRLGAEHRHSVTYAGRLTPDEVFPRLLDAQALVLLSAYEGLSCAIQEAMACGLPVVARRTASGVEAVLLHEDTALVIDDDSEFLGAVERLSTSQSLWQRLSRAARNLAEREFDIDRAADKWCALLNMLGSRGVRHPRPPSASGYAAYLQYLRGKSPLERYEAAFLSVHDARPEELSRRLLSPSAGDWHVRSERFYRAIEAGRLTRDDIQMIARALAAELEAVPTVSAADRYRVASLWQLAGEAEEAAAIFNELAATVIEHGLRVGSLYHLAEIAYGAGREDEAAVHVQACLDADPAHRAAVALAERLAGLACSTAGTRPRTTTAHRAPGTR